MSSGTLSEYGLTNITKEESIKKKFLENVNQGLTDNTIMLLPSVPLPIPFPDSGTSDEFYTDDDTIDSHEIAYPAYHEIIFPMVEKLAEALNLQPVGPKMPPVQDPTTPLLKIINAIQLPGLSLEYILKTEVLTYVLENSKKFIDAAAALPGEWKDLATLMLSMPSFPIDEKDLELKLKKIEINMELPSLPMPSISIPVPPFIDIPTASIPLLSIEGVGIVNFILEMVNASINTLKSVITKIATPTGIRDFVASLSDGIIGIAKFIIELIIDPIIIVLEKFESLTKQLGWISTIGTIIKYTLAMMVMSITTFILGPGLVTQAIGQLFGII